MKTLNYTNTQKYQQLLQKQRQLLDEKFASFRKQASHLGPVIADIRANQMITEVLEKL